MSNELNSFIEYERGDRDIGDALGLTKDDREGFNNFLGVNDLEKCFSVSPKAVYPKCWVGTVCYRGRQIEILPKLLNADTAKEGDVDLKPHREDILNNLIFMLSYTHKLDIKTIDDATLNRSTNPFLEILIREYGVSLFDALKRQTPRGYVREEDNLNYIRGKIQITNNIRYNSCNQAKFYCEYDEFSEDNPLNRLFYYVTTILGSVSKNSRNRKIMTHIRNYYGDIQLQPVTKEQAGRIILGRSQQIFAKPLRLARMFLEHSSVDLSNHRLNSMALLWDMNVLFEEFVFELLRRNLPDYKVLYQKGKRLLQEDRSGNKRKDTFVDIFLEKGNKKIIVDTKYKKFTGWDDVSNSDVYQVVTYCLLHGANDGVLIYPKWAKDISDGGILNVDKGVDGYSIKFKTIDLRDKLFERNNFAKVTTEFKNYFQELFKC